MSNSIAMEHKLARLEREVQTIKQLLQTVLARLERTEPGNEKDALQARKDIATLVQSVAARINLSPEEAERLAHEAAKETRAHNPTL